MRNVSKKFWSISVTALLVFAGIATGGQPAMAQTDPYGGVGRTLTIGVPVDTYIGCTASQPGEVVSLYNIYTYNGESWPPGLSYDSATGHLTGTPNQIGTWTPPVIACQSNVDGLWNHWSYAWNVVNAVTPAPFLSVTNLNDNFCNIRVVGLLRATPTSGATKLTLTEGAKSIELTLRDYAIDEVIDLTIPLDGATLGQFAMSSTDILGTTGDAAPFNCSSTVQVTLATASAPSEPSSATAEVQVSSDVPHYTPTPSVQLVDLKTKTCMMQVIASLPVSNDAGTLVASITNGDAEVIATSPDHEGGEVFLQEFSLQKLAAGDISDLENLDNVSLNPGISGFNCGDTVWVTFSYQYRGNPSASGTSEHVTQTSPVSLPSKPGLSLYSNRDAVCSITVVVNIPQDADQGTSVDLMVGSMDGAYVIELTGLTAGVPAVLVLPLNDMPSFNSDYAQNSYELQGAAPRCGMVLAGGSMMVNGVTYDADVASVEAAISCNPGRYSTDEGVCAPATIGHYVNSNGARSQQTCPTGKTTLITGATSINDCLKMVTPTITALKAPKAVKFASKTLLVTKLSSGGAAKVTASGACTAKVTNIITKVKNKKVSTPGVAVTAKKTAGTCTLTFRSNANGLIQAYAKTIKVKVSKTGK